MSSTLPPEGPAPSETSFSGQEWQPDTAAAAEAARPAASAPAGTAAEAGQPGAPEPMANPSEPDQASPAGDPSTPDGQPPHIPAPGGTAPDDTPSEGPAPFENVLSGLEWQPDTESGGALPPTEPPSSSAAPAANPDAGPPASDAGPQGRAEGGEPMGLMDHLAELRTRLVRCCIAVGIGFGICWAVVDPIFDVLIHPLLAVLPAGTHAQYTTLPEAFFTRMYIAFVAGLFLASPAIFYQIWAFVAPGLYDEEKRYIVPIALLSAIFFMAGGAFCYFIVFPFAFSFFVSFSTPEIVVTPKVSDYLSFVLKLLIAFGLIFEMPIFTLFLARLGIITAAMMRKGRRYAIVGIFILAAILTPPDVISQLLMACPMLLLYEASIWVAAVFGKKRKAPADAEQEKAGAAPAQENAAPTPAASPGKTS